MKWILVIFLMIVGAAIIRPILMVGGIQDRDIATFLGVLITLIIIFVIDKIIKKKK